MDSIARGFQRSPFELVLVPTLVLLFIGFLAAIYIVQRRKAKGEAARLAAERYGRLVQKLGLQPAEQELVERLAAGLRDPSQKAQILLSSAAFNRSIERLRERGEPLPPALNDLRLRLGFRALNPEQVPAATGELPEELPVLVVLPGPEDARRFGASVSSQEPEALVLQASGSAPKLAPGGAVTVYFQNRSGLFSFSSEILSIHGGELRLAHTDRIHRTQRRRFYRRRVSTHVEVRRILSGGAEPPLTSRLLDLGGEGASLFNPQGRLSARDEVELRFRLGGQAFELSAQVLRISQAGKVAHLHFVSLRESQRDRLIGVLFQSFGEAER